MQIFIEAPAAQAVILFLITYTMGIIKTIHINYYVMSLVVVLMTWNGVYVSFITDAKSKFPVEHLKSIALAYLCGAVITLVVNLLIFPRSAEKELRTTLVKSLESLKCFVQTFENIHIFQISEDQIKKLHGLTQSIRNDSNELQAQFDQTFIDISFSRMSFSDYEEIVKQTRFLQRWVLSGFSTLEGFQDFNIHCFEESMFLELGAELKEMKRMIVFGITAVQEELGYKFLGLSYQNFPAIEEKKVTGYANKITQNFTLNSQTRNGELLFAAKNEENTQSAGKRQKLQPAKSQSSLKTSYFHPHIRPSRCSNSDTPFKTQEYHPAFSKSFTIIEVPQDNVQRSHANVKNLIRSYEQRNLEIHNKAALNIFIPGFQYNISSGVEFIKANTKGEANNLQLDFEKNPDSCGSTPHREPLSKEDMKFLKNELKENYSTDKIDALKRKASNFDSLILLIKIQSLSLLFNEFSKSLVSLWDSMERQNLNGDKRKKPKLCIYISPKINVVKLLKRKEPIIKNAVNSLCKNRALKYSRQIKEQLSNETHYNFCRPLNIKKHLIPFTRLLIKPQSACAAKSALGIVALTSIFWLDSSRKFALNYGLRSCVFVIFSLAAQTLGELYYNLAFRLIGYILGLAYATGILEIFHNVGGYDYNPFGVIISLGILSIPMCFLLYSNPRFLVLAFLAIHSAGSLVYKQAIEINLANKPPPITMAKYLTSLIIGN
ncbi:hypothetical protein BY996DRAFT_4098727 [Phakopsora pachyrhizi]|nr:hypothetical protein BY996DRAFT_4098727 [Phakopsora pachyrhizi]